MLEKDLEKKIWKQWKQILEKILKNNKRKFGKKIFWNKNIRNKNL